MIFVVDSAVMKISLYEIQLVCTRAQALRVSMGMANHVAVTKIKTTKIIFGAFFRLFTKHNTPENNYPPYDITCIQHRSGYIMAMVT